MRLAQGRENAKDFLRENPDIANQIEDDIRGLAFEDQGKEKPKGEVEYDEEDYEEDEYEEQEEA
jgi:recombination protein RecA